VGLAVIALGGGRTTPEDKLDYSVGYSSLAGVGKHVDGETPIGRVHAADEAAADQATQALQASYSVGGVDPEHTTILHRLAPDGFQNHP
ncbi:MAG: thymidine phosphorylase, partial [Hyphomicrobiales bacterium]